MADEMLRLLKDAPPIGERESLETFVARGGYEGLRKTL